MTRATATNSPTSSAPSFPDWKFEELAKKLDQVAAQSTELLEGDDAIAPEQDDVDLQLVDPDDCVPFDYVLMIVGNVTTTYEYCYEEDIDLEC